MAKKVPTYVPSMSDAAVKAKTGRDWKGWFGLLDKAGAEKLSHKAIAQLLHEQYGVPGWWRQTVTVEYERARGLRDVHEKTDGYSVAVTKTIATSLPKLYAATATAAARRKWFPDGTFTASSQTKDKYLRGSWQATARLEIGFYSKGAGKSQIAAQINKLAKKADVEAQRAIWKQALQRLQGRLEL